MMLRVAGEVEGERVRDARLWLCCVRLRMERMSQKIVSLVCSCTTNEFGDR